MKHILKTHSVNFKYTALLICALALFWVSCSKTTETIGNGLLSESDHIGVGFADTLRITSHSEQIDTMYTKGITTVLLGSMMDPIMGLSNAGIITQLHLSSTNQYFGDNPVIDSVVLQLSVTGCYGDTTTLQTVHVYELADSLLSSSQYYQFSDVEVKPVDLANGYQFRPRPHTVGQVVGNDTLSQAVIRIPLANSFGEQLAAADSTIFSTPDAFKQYCYGLKICCESVGQDGAICYLNPTSNTVTQLQVYYRENPEANQMRYYFYITSEDVYFNQYLHDYTLGDVDFVQQVVQGDTALGQQRLYLQSMGGIRCVLRFTDLLEWADALQEEGAHLIINEAKLILPASAVLPDSSCFSAPTSLALLNIKDDGGTSILPDYLEGSSYFGGVYSSTNKTVSFRISEYLQEVIGGSLTSQGIYVSVTGASYNAYRWVVAGPDAEQEQQLKCEVKYSIVRE